MLVELQAPNGDRALKPGAYSQVIFPLAGLSTSVSVPASALIVGADGTRAAVIGPDGKAVLRTIRVGRDMGNTVEVLSGLTAADRVINSPPDSLQTGDEVHIAGDAKGAADAHR